MRPIARLALVLGIAAAGASGWLYLHQTQPVAVRVQAAPAEAGWLQLQVSDDGRGISADNLRRIFDPFFTTRLGQGGSGLGLHIVYTLVTGLLGG